MTTNTPDPEGLRAQWRGKVSNRVRLLRLAMRQDGVTNADAQQLLQITVHNASGVLAALEKLQYLQRLPKVGTGCNRWRITEVGIAALAGAGQAGPQLVPVGEAIRTITPRPGRMAESITRGLSGKQLVVPVKPAHDAPVTIRGDSRPKGRPIFSTGATATQGKAAGHDPRYQVGPEQAFSGAGFRSLKPGQYLDEPRRWGA